MIQKNFDLMVVLKQIFLISNHDILKVYKKVETVIFNQIIVLIQTMVVHVNKIYMLKVVVIIIKKLILFYSFFFSCMYLHI